MNKGILLNENNDLAIHTINDTHGKIKRGLVISNTLVQNAFIALKVNQGEIKADPMLGANLDNFIRSTPNRTAVEKRIKIHLSRAGIDFNKIKNQ